MPNANVLKALFALLCAGFTVVIIYTSYQHGVQAENLRWQQVIEDQKKEARELLAAEQRRVKDKEAALQALKQQTEARDAQAQHTIESIRAENRRLVAAAGGVLYDPGSRPSGSCTADPASGSASVPSARTAGTGLSVEASEFLLDFAYRADEAARYAKSCREWSLQLMRRLNDEGEARP